MRGRSCASLLLAFILGGSASTGIADDEPAGDGRIRQHVEDNMRRIDVESLQPSRQLTMRPQPLMKWSNPTRGQLQSGVVHVWESDGRPEAIGCSFTYAYNDTQRFKMQLHSLSESALQATFNEETVWRPAAGGIKWQQFEGTPDPAKGKRLRLTQMRQLARRFRVTVTTRDEEDAVLRLLPQPLHRYESATHGITDGVIFSFVTATDPDALLLIETEKAENGERFRYAFARFHFWALSAVDEDGTQVWSADADMTQMLHRMGEEPQHLPKPYVSFHVESYPVGLVPEVEPTD